MLNVLIIIGYITWILCFFINGFTLYSCLVVIPVTLFAIRRIGIHMKLTSILTSEIMFIIFSMLWRFLFNTFELLPFILTLLVRMVFICIVVYDETVYVYVTEERKKT